MSLKSLLVSADFERQFESVLVRLDPFEGLLDEGRLLRRLLALLAKRLQLLFFLLLEVRDQLNLSLHSLHALQRISLLRAEQI